MSFIISKEKTESNSTGQKKQPHTVFLKKEKKTEKNFYKSIKKPKNRFLCDSSVIVGVLYCNQKNKNTKKY